MKRTSLAVVLLLLGTALAAPSAPAGHEDEDDPPLAIPDVQLATPHEDRWWPAVNETPTWTWEAAIDDHGIDRYEITEYHDGDLAHEATSDADDRSYQAQAAEDAYVCVEVTPVDTADQRGPTTAPRCATFDATPPENSFVHPDPGVLSLADGEVIDVQPPAEGHTYALGELTVRLEGSDPGQAASGLQEVTLYEDLDGPLYDEDDRTTHRCENDIYDPRPWVCEWTDRADGLVERPLTGWHQDRAGNTVETHLGYTMVDLAAVERPSLEGTTATIHWEPYEGERFAGYAVYAIQEDDPAGDAPARLVGTVDDRQQVSLVDEAPQLGETWTYQQVTLTGPGAMPEVTHATTLTFAGEDGRASTPSGCTASTVCPFAST